ncbi:MAG TPA: hypothetical protein PKH37_06525, partial [Alphaproteobacteria bacterium]|nr:hypothetical protein [Alphaproteobacteria bacterium]
MSRCNAISLSRALSLPVPDWERVFVAFLFLVTLWMLACGSAFAQQTAQQPVRYNSVALSDFTDKALLAEKFYIVEDPDYSLTLPEVEEMIRSGTMLKHLYKSSIYNMGYKGNAAWIVIPVSSISNYNTWKLSFGTQFEGRYSPLKSFVLYNMNTKSFLFNTDSSTLPTKLVPETFAFHAKPNTTTFLLLYVRSAPGISTVLAPQIINPRLETPLDFWSRWIMAALSLSGFLALLSVYRTTGNISYIFISLVWALVFVRHLLVTNFLYLDFLDSDLYIPLTWIFSSFLLLGALWTSPGMKEDLPPSLIIGAASLFMISSITGLILIRPMPSASAFLIYGPIAASCVLITLSTWPFILVGRRRELLSLAFLSFFLAGMIFWHALMTLGLVSVNLFRTGIEESLLGVSIISSVI